MPPKNDESQGRSKRRRDEHSPEQDRKATSQSPSKVQKVATRSSARDNHRLSPSSPSSDEDVLEEANVLATRVKHRFKRATGKVAAAASSALKDAKGVFVSGMESVSDSLSEGVSKIRLSLQSRAELKHKFVAETIRLHRTHKLVRIDRSPSDEQQAAFVAYEKVLGDAFDALYGKINVSGGQNTAP